MPATCACAWRAHDPGASRGRSELSNYAQALLDEGVALVVLDGLDEVTHPG
ncbi:MAG TPA: hypothetical protein VI547_13155 [Anaerolineales bacterium]|nr:hypothetical protein [Anaerolineales bacterium]